MRQVLWTVPGLGIKVFGYGLMLFIAYLGSMNLAAWRAKREKLDPEVIYDLAIWTFVGGLLGARTFYVVQYWGIRIKSFWDIFKVWEGGIVLYGSIMGGTAAFFLYWWLRKFPLRPTLDAIAPALALGIALGRLGCFLNGCCYGDRCDDAWAVRFPPGSAPWFHQATDENGKATDRVIAGINSQVLKEVTRGRIPEGTPWSLPVHPTQLYSTVDGLVLVVLLSAFYPLRKRDGEVMALLMVTYPITRFLVEYLRNDEGAFFGGMTISQSVSILLMAGGLAFWLWLSLSPPERFADGPGTAAPA
jgi:phosphatidylglycerol:prolipoprotein diacylglycerol transferase